jgi:low affinity Fe/Cu permease
MKKINQIKWGDFWQLGWNTSLTICIIIVEIYKQKINNLPELDGGCIYCSR